MTRDHTAIHEAGHAVIGRVLGMLCGGATIVRSPEEGEAGHAITEDPYGTLDYWGATLRKYRADEMRSIICGRIITVMAGAEAEAEILGKCRGGDGNDRRQITQMTETHYFPIERLEEWSRWEPRMRRQTRRLVRRHRATIQRVADNLKKRKTLTAEEIDAIMLVV